MLPVPALPFSTKAAAVDALLRSTTRVWRGHSVAAAPSVATGLCALDRLLPGLGWPLGAVSEIVPTAYGIGELRLVLPALRRITCEEARPAVLVRPPHIPYPPALLREGLPLRRLLWLQPPSTEEAQWAAEQCLRAGIAGAVLLWTDSRADLPLRRLQLAAEEGRSLAFVYRPPATLRNPSPAAVRLALSPARQALRIEVVKARGGHGGSIHCPLGGTA